MSDHVDFMIGDVLNLGHAKWGDKYTAAVNRTRRARSPLKNYAWVVSQIPPNERIAALSFSHHKEIASLERPKRLELLADLEKQAEIGELPRSKPRLSLRGPNFVNVHLTAMLDTRRFTCLLSKFRCIDHGTYPE